MSCERGRKTQMTDVFLVRIDHRSHADDVRRLAPHVSAARREKAAKFRFVEDYNRSIVAELLVRYVACTQYEAARADTDWGASPTGKPCLPSLPALRFNLTHSGDYAACAFDDDEIGIDLERVASIDYAGIAERYFAASERSYLARSSGEDEALGRFYRLWTQKESFLKAVGTGLRRPLDSFAIEEPELPESFADAEGRRWFLRTTPVGPDYMLSVCRSRPVGEIRLTQLPLESLAAFYKDTPK